MAWISWYAQRSISDSAKDIISLVWAMPERQNKISKRETFLYICVASKVRRSTSATGE